MKLFSSLSTIYVYNLLLKPAFGAHLGITILSWSTHFSQSLSSPCKIPPHTQVAMQKCQTPFFWIAPHLTEPSAIIPQPQVRPYFCHLIYLTKARPVASLPPLQSPVDWPSCWLHDLIFCIVKHKSSHSCAHHSLVLTCNWDESLTPLLVFCPLYLGLSLACYSW